MTITVLLLSGFAIRLWKRFVLKCGCRRCCCSGCDGYAETVCVCVYLSFGQWSNVLNCRCVNNLLQWIQINTISNCFQLIIIIITSLMLGKTDDISLLYMLSEGKCVCSAARHYSTILPFPIAI